VQRILDADVCRVREAETPPRRASRTRRPCRPGTRVRQFQLIYDTKDPETRGKGNGSRSTGRRTITTTWSLRSSAARWRWRASRLAELVDAAQCALRGRQRPRGYRARRWTSGARGFPDKSQGHGEAVRGSTRPKVQ